MCICFSSCKVSSQHCCTETLLHVAGSLVFEEDSIGDAMYVVLSGVCEIRARPAHAASIPQQQSQPTSSVLVRPRHRQGSSESDSDASEEEEEGSARPPPRVARSEAEHSASFWIHKYMEQVLQCLHHDSTGFSGSMYLQKCGKGTILLA